MILADTSVWIDHLRKADPALQECLQARLILTHPFIIGELALVNLQKREIVLQALRDLPSASVATDSEVLHFIESRCLFGRGIGYIDAHLLASVTLTNGATLWTSDKRLHDVATQLGFAAGKDKGRLH